MPAKRPITAEDLLKFTWVADAQISPDGTRIAFVRKVVGKRNAYETSIWVVASRGRGRAKQVTSGPKDSAPRWIGETGSLVFVRSHPKKPSQIATVSAAGGAVRLRTKLPESSIGAVSVSPDGRLLAYSCRRTSAERTKSAAKARAKSGASTPPWVIDDPWYRLDGDGYFGSDRYRLRLLDLKSGRDREVYTQDTLGTFSFDFAPDSRTVAITTSRHPKALLESWHDEIVLLDVASGKVRAVPGLPPGPKTSVKFSPDGKRLAWAGRKSGRDGLYSTENLGLWVAPRSGGTAHCLTKRTDFCLMAATLSDCAEPSFAASFHWMPDSQSLLLRLGWHGEGQIVSIDADSGAIAFHTFGAAENQINSISRDGCTCAVLRSTPTELAEVHAMRIDGMQFPMQRLTNFNTALLAKLELAEPECRWCRAADGTSVQYWCLRPKRRRAGKSPAILQVHGGPHAQYGSTLFHEFQFLAAQGYTVFYSNPRGSKGYGRDFCAAIRGAWGTADWVDVQAVLRTMKRQPFVDRNRVGIMGGSYGGYMTNWAIGHDRSLRAAITDRCVSNLISHSGNSDFPEVPNTYWKGAPFSDPTALWRSSPVAHLHRVKTPTLIIHSEGDLRCNIEQGEQVHAALVVQGVPTRLVRYPRESSHGMSRAGPVDLRLHRLGQIADWWQRWMD